MQVLGRGRIGIRRHHAAAGALAPVAVADAAPAAAAAAAASPAPPRIAGMDGLPGAGTATRLSNGGRAFVTRDGRVEPLAGVPGAASTARVGTNDRGRFTIAGARDHRWLDMLAQGGGS
jgi:hypothetical protein